MSARLYVDVIGNPAPQGSKKHVGNGVMVESSKAVGPWRDAVAYAVHNAVLAARWTPLDEAASVFIQFYVPRPPSAPKKRIKPDRAPDIDKLARATLDGIVTGRAVSNDARIVQLHLDEDYCEPAQPSGARIEITRWAPF
ncbi:MAG TPA: RusA family crossover junction endodeoxyribonuclease [Jatrophihabitantaceae bacterium]|jgi:crossover junction endodeoxyribonuclease RusA